MWANINPTGHLDDVQAAVVNQDELVEVKDRKGEKQPVAIGRQLAGNLTRDDSGKNFDWVLTDAQRRAAGPGERRVQGRPDHPEELLEGGDLDEW